MKRTSILVLALTVLHISIAQAGIDPDPDMIGIYFDQDANISDQIAPANVPIFAYVILTNPSQQGITDYEFGYRIALWSNRESEFFRLANVLPAGALDSGDSSDPLQGDYVVLLADPLPAGVNLVLVTWQFMLVDVFVADLYLEPATNSAHGFGYPSYNVEDELYGLFIAGACGILDGGGMPSAYINSWCPLPVEPSLFGSVKSLYR